MSPMHYACQVAAADSRATHLVPLYGFTIMSPPDGRRPLSQPANDEKASRRARFSARTAGSASSVAISVCVVSFSGAR